MKVLVVDDYQSAATVTAHMFEMMGHDVDVAYSGLEALEKAYKSRPDLVLLDISMPGMDGIETCMRMRESRELKNIRIVAQTGRGDDETIEACVQAGFNEHLTKPIEFKYIEEIIESMSS